MGGLLEPGDVVDGKYAIERIIGRGGAGYVAVARHLVLDRLVALKFLRPERQLDSDLSKRFVREARAAAQMKGPHVARVLDADTSRAGGPYLVMELLEGEDMAAHLRRRGPMPVAEAVDCILQACEAVQEAHSLRIIHRDLKPANLFLTSDEGRPFVKVLDFGLSKEIGGAPTAENLTDSNHVVGSPHFMAPEQIRTPKDVDERTDIWALGATLFDLLTGHVPFEGRSMMEVCAALLCGPPPRIDRYRSDVPAALEEVVLRCLRIEASERPQSITELAELLLPFAPASAQKGIARTGPVPRVRWARASGRRLALAAGLTAGIGLAFLAWRVKSAPLMGSVVRERTPAAEEVAQTAPLAPAEPVGAEPGLPLVPSAIAAAPIAAHRDAVPGYKAAHAVTAELHVPERAAQKPPDPPPAETRTRPSCAQPFYIDSQGLKAVRAECL